MTLWGADMNNAMFGMNPSLQLAKDDSLRDLMRGGSDHMVGAMAMDSFDDAGGTDQVNDNDDFNADALLMSPMFNDSGGENIFGQFEETHDTLLGRPDVGRAPMPPSREYSEPMQRPSRPAIVRESRSVKMPSASNGMQSMGMNMMHPGQLQSSFGGFNSRMQVPPTVGCGDGSFREMDDGSYLETSQSDMQDYSMQSYRTPPRRMPEHSYSNNSSFNSGSFQSEPDASPVMGMQQPSSMYQAAPRPMLTSGRSLPPKAQSYAGTHHSMGGSQTNDLAAMRQQLQQLRESEIRESMQHSQGRHMNSANKLSQSMHMPVQRTASANASLSQSMHFEPGRSSFAAGTPGIPSFSGGNNVSIASDTRSFKPSFNRVGETQSGGSNVNEAMEKLCESMKRSAMSRSLVKQYSSGGRAVSRHGSGQLFAMRQGAGRNAMDDSSSGRNAPIRRHSSAKHQLHHPVRGLYRHDSSQGANGKHSINFQIDGRPMGM